MKRRPVQVFKKIKTGPRMSIAVSNTKLLKLLRTAEILGLRQQWRCATTTSAMQRKLTVMQKQQSTFRQQISAIKAKGVSVSNSSPLPLAKLSIPGLSAESYNVYGHPKVKSMLYAATLTRFRTKFVPFNDEGETFMEWDRLNKDLLTFMQCLHATFSKELYDPKTDASHFNAEVKLGYVGNSSVATVVDLFSTCNDQVPLLRKTNQSVAVDLRTRKPIALPDWYKDKFGGSGVLDQGLIIKPVSIPDKTFTYDLQVRWSDTDVYQHTNYASYVTFAEDAIFSAITQENKEAGSSGLKGLSEATLMNGVKDVQIIYQAESVEGQHLCACVWQTQAEGPHTVRVTFTRAGRPVCQLRIEYFSD